ncbi:MAG TPA: electron transport complex protein RnfC [Firmicutes bacterium]|nr:electron transport complex protein RnfC [Bacillota bacterium]
MREAVAAAGVVGAGGAGFPTAVKLEAQVEYVIANAAECEPLLQGNQELILHAAGEIITGIKAVMLATGARKGIIALKGKHQQQVEHLRVFLQDREDIELFLLDDFYPAGDEYVLVYEALGRIIPEAGLPLDVGAVVNNVETLYNVARALQGIPVTERLVTVTGWVEKPLTVSSLIGTPFRRLVELARPQGSDFAVLEGGPMMGVAVEDLDKPVTKTTGGLIVLPSSHQLLERARVRLAWDLKRAQAVCCNCTACTETCPRHLIGHDLEPHRIMKGLAWNMDSLDLSQALLCSECGLCESYACVMDLSPRRINRYLKSLLQQQGIKFQRRNKELVVDPWCFGRRIPTSRLCNRLGLAAYVREAPLNAATVETERIILPLRQHIGAPSQAVVKVGERVEAGALVAQKPAKSLGANIHTGLSGRVEKVSAAAIVITREGG